jgi:hypothetical protein
VYLDNKTNPKICCYGLIGNKIVFKKNVQDFSKSTVTRIVASLDNESYFIGCKDGSVHVIRSLDFEHAHEYEFKITDSNLNNSPSQVTDIFADSLIFIVCFHNGEIHIYEKKKKKEEKFSFSFGEKFDFPLYSLKVSFDGQILVVYYDN